MPVQVKLNTSANPPVTVQPPVHSVNKGNQTITWVPFANQNFTFVSLGFANNPSCFSTPTVRYSNHCAGQQPEHGNGCRLRIYGRGDFQWPAIQFGHNRNWRRYRIANYKKQVTHLTEERR